MQEKYDVIVIGAGSMGASALYHLAKRGQKVLGLEQFGIVHDRGSHHGESRLIRFAYQEGAEYVPLLLRARELWRGIESETGQKLFHETGGLSIAEPGPDGYLERICRFAETYKIPHKTLNSGDVNRLYPAFRVPGNYAAVLDEWAGYILCEKAVAAFARAAQAHGAEIRKDTKVLSWESDGGQATVTTDKGTYAAPKLVIAAGVWFARLVPELLPVLQTRRTAVSWYLPARPENFAPDRLPIFTIRNALRNDGCYGVPICGGVPGMKIGPHAEDPAVDPDTVSRDPVAADERATRRWVEEYFDLKGAECLRTGVCLYTMLPDEGFILGPHPAHRNVVLGHACSGHGFKFTPVIGEILADFVTTGAAKLDISAHRPERFMDSKSSVLVM